MNSEDVSENQHGTTGEDEAQEGREVSQAISQARQELEGVRQLLPIIGANPHQTAAAAGMGHLCLAVDRILPLIERAAA